MSFIATSIIAIAVSVGLVLLIKRNLRQRPTARRLRTIFISAAEDLVGKAEFPDEAAKFLITLSAVPAGWLTRAMFAVIFSEMAFGRGPRARQRPVFESVPQHLRVKYVQALFALALSDSYHCAVLGRVWRGANLWVLDAVKEPKPDVNAHATRRVVEQVSHVKTPRHLEHCVAAA